MSILTKRSVTPPPRDIRLLRLPGPGPCRLQPRSARMKRRPSPGQPRFCQFPVPKDADV